MKYNVGDHRYSGLGNLFRVEAVTPDGEIITRCVAVRVLPGFSIQEGEVFNLHSSLDGDLDEFLTAAWRRRHP